MFYLFTGALCLSEEHNHVIVALNIASVSVEQTKSTVTTTPPRKTLNDL